MMIMDTIRRLPLWHSSIAVITLFLTLCSVAVWSQEPNVATPADGFTFVVDGDLPAVPWNINPVDGDRIADDILSSVGLDNKQRSFIASSFGGQQLCRVGSDVLCSCFQRAYALHYSLVLSPDDIWLIICQGFSRYVDAHAEELRSLFVDHQGKMELTVRVTHDLLSDNADWVRLLDGFSHEIALNTKDSIAQTVIADFTTTGVTERIASQVTLMRTQRAYFEFKAVYAVCGIPSITLLGTPDDWRNVLEKTCRLRRYGLTQWVDELTPILQQFVNAAEGRPDRHFWQDVVKRRKVDELRGPSCTRSGGNPTKLDGWFLKLFPDENGHTMSSETYPVNMDSEMLGAGFKYVLEDSYGNPLDEIPMELWGGFVGADVDKTRRTIKPRIGWLVREGLSDETVIEELAQADCLTLSHRKNGWCLSAIGNLDIQGDDVPRFLLQLGSIKQLMVVFSKASMSLPEWLEGLKIGQLSVYGSLNKKQKESITQRFPQANFYK